MYSEIKRSTWYRLIAWLLTVCLVITLIPDISHATGSGGDTKISPEDVTEKNVTGRTEDTTTYDLGEGEKMTVFHGGQVRYEDEEGELIDYDRSLVKIKTGEKTEGEKSLDGYSYRNKEGDSRQYIPQQLSEDTPLIMERDGCSISMSPADETLQDLELTGASVTVKKENTPVIYEDEEKLPVTAQYSRMGAGADISYESGESGVKETMVLRERPESNVFRYVLDLEGLTPRKNPADQGITFYDDEDDIAADISPAWMNDATGSAYSEGITYDIEKESGSTYILTMTVDRDYLDDEDRQYPVTIDPTATWKGSTQIRDAYVISGSYADTNFYSSSTKVMPAGKNGTGTHRTYIFFRNLLSEVKGQSISSAKFTVYEVGDGAKNQKVSAYRVTKNWTASKITWNNKPTNASGANSSVTTTGKKYSSHTFSLKTFVSGLADGSHGNCGIVLKNVTSSPSYASFWGSRYGTVAYRPKLVVTYYSKPTTATSAGISPAYVKKSTEASLNFSGITSTGLARNEYKVFEYNDEAKENGDVKLAYSSSRTIKSGDALPSLPDGCYRIYVRGVNKAGVAGAGKSAGVVHVDSTAPSLGTVSISESTEARPGPADPVITWKGISDPHFKEVSVSVDGGTYKKAGTETSGTYTIPKETFEGNGTHTIKVKATDRMGNSTEKTFAGYYVCTDGPEIGQLRLRDSSGKAVTDSSWTGETDPVITFSDVRDEKSTIESGGISYALTSKGETPSDDDFKTPQDLSFQTDETGACSGSFHMVSSDRSKAGGKYDIHVRIENKLGNHTVKSHSYHLDKNSPKGTVTVSSISGTTVTGALSDTVIVTGSITDRQSDDDTAYSGIRDSSIRVYRKSGSDEQAKAILYRDMSESTSRPLDTTKYENGTYILRLTIEDEAGNTKTIDRQITIANRIVRPEITAEKSGDKIKLTWEWEQDAGNAKVQYRIGSSDSWNDISGSSSAQGSAMITEPGGEGAYTIYVRGVDTSGVAGDEAEVSYIVDRTAPAAELTSFMQGVVRGKAADDHLREWSISIKERTEADDTYETVLSGSRKVDGKFGFIDLSGEAFEAGKTYRLKLTVTDRAGNSTDAYRDITRGADKDTAQRIEPSFRVKRPAGQEYEDTHFSIGTQTRSLRLKTGTGSALDEDTAAWYVDGAKKAEGPSYSDDFSAAESTSYREGKDYDILAAGTDADGGALYSRALTLNGEKKDLGTGSSAEKSFTLSGKAVALRIDAPATASGKAVTYSIKTAGSGYESITPGRKISVSDIDAAALHADTFTLKLQTEADISSVEGISVTADVLEDETFSISSIEDYRPSEFSVKHQLNYKTYFSWQTASGKTDLPDDISFEVYRSTEDGFTPSDATLAASDISGQSYTEINTGYKGKYYYRVRAVQKDENDEIINSSGYSRQMYGRVADADEYLKRLGNREYWSYASMGLPQGDAKIEKSQGNFTYSQTDAEIPNEGVDVSFERTYNSQSSAMSSLGMGWSSSFDMEVLAIADTGGESDDSLVLRYGDGTLYQFTRTGDAGASSGSTETSGTEDEGSMDAEAAEDTETAEYISSLGKYVTLTKTHSEEEVSLPAVKKGVASADDKESVTITSDYTVEDKDGNEYRFNSFGRLVYMTEQNGNFAILEYAADSGLLSRVRTNRNIAMEIAYNDSDDGKDPFTIKSVNLPDGSSYVYDYAGSADRENVRLTSVTRRAAGSGGEITYRYEYDSRQEPKLDAIKDGMGNRYTVSYDSRGRADEMADPGGKKQKLTYSSDSSETITETVIKKGLLFGTKTISTETDRFDGWFGNCVESIDAAGNRTGYTYRDNLLVMTETDGQYQKVDAAKNVVIADRTGAETTSYDPGTDNVTREKSEDGAVTKYTYDGDDVIHEVSYDADGEKISDTEYGYDEDGNETDSYDSVTDEEELTEYYYEDSQEGLAGEVKKETSKEDGVQKSTTSYTYEYSDDGRKTEKMTETCGGITTVTTTVTDVMGRELSTSTSVGGTVKSEVVNGYDGFGRLIKTTVTQGDTTTVTSSTYDANDTVLTETDADGTVTSYTYDDLNRVESRNVQKGSLSKTWTTEYGYEDITLHTGAGTQTSEDTYTVTEKDPDGYITSQTFTDPLGNVVREKADGMYTDRTFDRAGNTIASYVYGESSAGEGGILTLSLYNENGNQTHTAVKPSVTDGTYNIGGDCIVTESRYDADGNVTASIDGEGHKTSMSYDIEGQLKQVLQPGGAVTKFAYGKVTSDGTSRVTTTDAGGNKSDVVTDARGLETSITDYAGGTTAGIQRTYEYDWEGNVTKEKELEGNYKTFTYDSKGRNTVVKYHKADGTETLKTAYTYDVNDQVTLMEDFEKKNGSWELYRSTKYTYDALKRMSSYTEWDGEGAAPAEPTVSYTYDIEGNVTAVDYAGTGSELTGLTFEYDSSRKLTKIKADTGGLFKDTVREYEYDAQGRVSVIKDHYDFTGGGDYLEKSYTYDDFGRVTSMAYRGGSGHDDIREAYVYTYDRNNNIKSERIVSDYDKDDSGTGRDITRVYTYDTAGRLTETRETESGDETAGAGITSYTYDKAGNRLTETKSGSTTSYSYNDLDQLTECRTNGESKTYSYDRNGNQTLELTKEGNTEKEQRLFTYDEANQIKKMVVVKNDEVIELQENVYNGNGKIIRTKELVDGESTVKKYFYQDTFDLFTTDENNKVIEMNILSADGRSVATIHNEEDIVSVESCQENTMRVTLPDLVVTFYATAYRIFPQVYNNSSYTLNIKAIAKYERKTSSVNLGNVKPHRYSDRKSCKANLETAFKQPIDVIFEFKFRGKKYSKESHGSRQLEEKFRNQWHKGSYSSKEGSITYHYNRHGVSELKMTCIRDYVSQADKYRKTLKRKDGKLCKKGHTPYVYKWKQRYKGQKRYIMLKGTKAGPPNPKKAKIISFGK
ncbi:MAG: DNRLRE domain-containing protein [Anaerovoracaceae bacterium]